MFRQLWDFRNLRARHLDCPREHAPEGPKGNPKHSRVGGGDHRPVRKRRNLESPNAPSEILEYERYLPQAAVAYLKFRKISEASTSKWELGWDAESLRIVIPVHDSRGRVRLLVRRTIKPRVEPRYLYSEGVERNSLLFGIGQIDLGLVRSEGIILVEGTLDCIILHQYGFTNTVAILGSKVSEIQARKIANMRPTRVYTMFDADGAGVGATISARRRLPGNVIKVCRYPKGKTDPASLDEKEAHRVIQRAVTYSKFERATRIRSTRRRISVG